MDAKTIEALGKLRKALETTERARGHLYSFHQLTGTADFELDAAMAALREAGHADHANRVQRDLSGRNVLPGRWTFQIVEEYDDMYYDVFRDVERAARDDLAGGQRHGLEKELKRDRQRRSAATYADND
ncbi:hypothetical protein SAMN04488564_11216 [Lentzea waywayandensis]|uniref:Uncharacterized protein n=1 Tax=Lentzea waywayandensis TaxID=84724 RepID=A0A1I6FD54_9PSEU|nr:hypothetical protein [Lentzea waywayandensis]SFR27905.1 hypothetical protein SAMN04488564_11216 [Lentzea waywayandensis]